ncbi:MAG: hypothetical protein DCF16_18900 [Alphaproteobacteria bacterium]|nr:MAG: hypothetical protein DCF16_18900 [Alphaproteobacteria bacterium]
MSSPPDHRFAPLPLWRAAGAFLETLFNLFGAPERLAARHTILGPEHKHILNWLRCAEALMRRLLFIEASHYPKPNIRPLLYAKRARKRRTMEFWPDRPEQWRVSFRVFPSSPAHSGGSAERRSRKAKGPLAPSDRFAISSSARGGDVTFHSAWPLAERFEALLRVHNNPAPYARRLSRRLHARPHLAAVIVRAPHELQHRIAPAAHAEIESLIEGRRRSLTPDTS